MTPTIDLGRVGYGTLQLCDSRISNLVLDRGSACRLLQDATDEGVRLIDTANVYGQGACEEIVCEALAPYSEGLVIATKGGFERNSDSSWRLDGRPDTLRRACEESLKRLKVDAVPLYQLHAVDPLVPIEESIGALVDLAYEGKIVNIGVCNVTLSDFSRVLAAARLVTVQQRYNLLHQDPSDLVESARSAGVTFIGWAPFGGGTLLQADGIVARLAREASLTPAQLLLLWLMDFSGADIVPIFGTSSRAHLAENIACTAGQNFSTAAVQTACERLTRVRRRSNVVARGSRSHERQIGSVGPNPDVAVLATRDTTEVESCRSSNVGLNR